MILLHFCGVTKLGEPRWCCSDGSYWPETGSAVRRDGRSIISPQFMGSPKMVLFIAERAYDLFLASAPGGVYTCLSGIAVWISTPLDTPGQPLLFPLLAEVLIPFHGCKTSDPKLFPQGCQTSSCLQKADGVLIISVRSIRPLRALSHVSRSLPIPQRKSAIEMLSSAHLQRGVIYTVHGILLFIKRLTRLCLQSLHLYWLLSISVPKTRKGTSMQEPYHHLSSE